MRKHFCLILVLLAVVLTTRAEWAPGLLGGYYRGDYTWTGLPTEMEPYAGPHAASMNKGTNPEVWFENCTWVYTGQIYLDGGPYVFAEQIDDNTRLRIDGEIEISTGGQWDDFVKTRVLTLPAGWHDFEVRFFNGSQGAGAYNQDANGRYCGFGMVKGGRIPASMAECVYPEDPGDMSLFRYDDGTPYGRSLYIQSDPPSLDLPGLLPARGTITNLSAGATVECSAPATVVRDGRHYRCAGYYLQELVDGLYQGATTNLGVTTCQYVHGDHSTRLVWLYENDGYLLDAAPTDPSVSGTVELVPPSDLGGGYYTAGTSVTVTFRTDGGHVTWLGDVDGGGDGASVTVVMDRPRVLRAAVGGNWIYDPGTKTIDDGNWTLNVTAEGVNLSVIGVKSVTDGSVLDLRKSVASSAMDELYEIVSVGGFEGREDLLKVSFPDSLHTIRQTAFRNCTALETVTPFLPARLASIGAHAFAHCHSLGGDVVFPSNTISVLTAGEQSTSNSGGMFTQTRITSCDLSGATMNTIYDWTFYRCGDLRWVKLPKGLRRIGQGAFYHAENLTSVTPFLPATVNQIGGAAFCDIPKVEMDLVLPNPEPVTFDSYYQEVGTFEDSGILSATFTARPNPLRPAFFKNCVKLGFVRFPDVPMNLEYPRVFIGCSALTNVTPFLPPVKSTVADSIFYRCSALRQPLVIRGEKDLELGISVIGKSAISSVTIEAPVTRIGIRQYQGSSTLSDASSLHTVTLPETIDDVGPYTFSQDTALTNLTFKGDCPSKIASAFGGIPPLQARVFVPRFNESWERFAETNTAIVPLTEADGAAYRAIYPEGSLPCAVWSISGTKLWYSDKPYDGGDAFYVRGDPVTAGDVSPAYGLQTVQAGEQVVCTAPANAVYEGAFWVCRGAVVETEVENRVWQEIARTDSCSIAFRKADGQQQRVTWLWDNAAHAIDTSVFGGGSGIVELDPPADFGETSYLPGAVVTLTARPAEGYVFRRWFGDVPEEKAFDPVATLTMDGAKTCRPVFSHGWLHDAAAKTITDGNWVLKTTGAPGSLKVTGITSVTDKSILDLAAPVTATDGSPCTIKAIGNGAFRNTEDLVYLFLPETLTTVDHNAFWGCKQLQRVDPFLPESVSVVGDSAFRGCPELVSDLRLVSTNLDRIGFASFCASPKIRRADLSGVRRVGEYAFQVCDGLEEVVFSDRLTSIENNAFDKCRGLKRVLPVFLPTSLKSVGGSVFDGCRLIEQDLHLPNVTAYRNRSFCGSVSVHNVYFSTNAVNMADANIAFFAFAKDCRFHFPGKAPKNLKPNNYVFSDDDQTHRALYGSLRMDPEGWAAIATPLTEADKARPDYPGPKTFGVYVESGWGRAVRHWCVDYRSPYEKKVGTVLLIR